MLVGYARVSTLEQDTRLQIDALKRAGVDRVYQEKTSSIGRRPVLQTCLSSLRRGDVLVVYKIDRFARSLKDLLAVLDRIADVGACIRSLSEPLDTTSPMGIFMLQILGAVAQLERSMIRERSIAGMVAARHRGVVWGGTPLALSSEDGDEVYRLHQAGYFTQRELADMFGCSLSTVRRACEVRRHPNRVVERQTPVLGQYLQLPLSM